MLRRILVSQARDGAPILLDFSRCGRSAGDAAQAVPLHDGAPTTFGLALAADRIESFSMRNPPGAPITRGLRR